MALRFYIYEMMIAEDDHEWQLTPSFSSGGKGGSNVPSDQLLPLTHVCKLLRVEYLQYWMPRLHVSLHISDVERFIKTLYRTVHIVTLCPNATTVYITGSAAKAVGTFYPPSDLLPLAKLRLRQPKLSCTFAADPKEQRNQTLPPFGAPSTSLSMNAVMSDCRDIEKLIGYEEDSFLSFIKGKRLVRIILYPGLPWSWFTYGWCLVNSHVCDAWIRRTCVAI